MSNALPPIPYSLLPTASPRRIFAIADTHLGAMVGKTMDRFGAYWIGHAERIRENCAKLVGPEDILLLPGDLSWALKRWEAEPDLAFLASLPGIKVAIKGNHDYWWASNKQLDYPGLLCPPIILDDGAIGIAGTRGWYVPVPGSETVVNDRKIFEREQHRLEQSLEAIAHCAIRIAMLHYPPQPFLPELKAAKVHAVAYGHIHLGSLPEDEVLALDGELVEGIPFYCVACDRINFTPRLLSIATAENEREASQ